MELNKFERQLKLIQLLVDNQHLTIQDMGTMLGLSSRSVYRYIQFFESNGFDIYNDQGIYSMGHNSSFMSVVTKKTHFSMDELSCLGGLIARADAGDPVVNRLKYRFRNIYGMDFGKDDFRFDKKISENIEVLRNAIEDHCQCVLQRYNSLNSKDQRDRLVEPFQLMSNTNEVRCFELESGICKTFKVTRIKGRVLRKEKKWEHADKHVNYFTDIFGFSSEQVLKVILRLTTVSKTILMEEFGLDENRFVQEDDIHYLIHLPVCNMKGAGRFVMGLIDEVEIVKGEELREYVNRKIQSIQKKLTYIPHL